MFTFIKNISNNVNNDKEKFKNFYRNFFTSIYLYQPFIGINNKRIAIKKKKKKFGQVYWKPAHPFVKGGELADLSNPRYQKAFESWKLYLEKWEKESLEGWKKAAEKEGKTIEQIKMEEIKGLRPLVIDEPLLRQEKIGREEIPRTDLEFSEEFVLSKEGRKERKEKEKKERFEKEKMQKKKIEQLKNKKAQKKLKK